MDLFEFVVSVILVVFFAINVFSLRKIYGFARDAKFQLPALNERAITTGIKTVGTGLMAILGMNRILEWHWSVVPVLIILSIAVVLHTLPPIIWLWYLYTGRFRSSPEFKGEDED